MLDLVDMQSIEQRISALEKRQEELEARITALEQVQVTRQEFDELKVTGIERVQHIHNYIGNQAIEADKSKRVSKISKVTEDKK